MRHGLIERKVDKHRVIIDPDGWPEWVRLEEIDTYQQPQQLFSLRPEQARMIWYALGSALDELDQVREESSRRQLADIANKIALAGRTA